MNTFYGILIPFLGTTLGAACVFFLKKALSESLQRALTGFAAGVMVAASVWSLLIPAIEQASGMGRLSFAPAVIGFWCGILFLLLLDHVIPHLHRNCEQTEGPSPFAALCHAATGRHTPQHPEGMARRRHVRRLPVRKCHCRRCTGSLPLWASPSRTSGRSHYLHAPASRGHEQVKSLSAELFLVSLSPSVPS